MEIKDAAFKEKKTIRDTESRGNKDLHAFVVLTLAYNISE